MDEPTSASVSAITATGASLLCGGALWLLCAPPPTEASESRRMNGAIWLAITLLIALLALCAVAYAVAHAGPLPVDLSLRDAVNVSTGNAPMQLALRIIGRFNRYRL